MLTQPSVVGHSNITERIVNNEMKRNDPTSIQSILYKIIERPDDQYFKYAIVYQDCFA